MKIPEFTILLLLILSFEIANSQGFSWKKYSVEDGLSTNEISEIIQDDLGYLWILNGNALSKFDGRRFSNYVDKSNYMVMRNIKMIRPKQNGEIQFNTALYYGKVSQYGTFSYTTSDSSLSYQYIPDREAYMFFDNFIDNDGYKVFSRHRGKRVLKKSDTLFYEFNNNLNFLLLPRNLKREKGYIKTDYYHNIWIQLLDTLNNKQSYISFTKGNIYLIANSVIKNGNAIKDKNGNCWIIGDSIIQCFKNKKEIKVYKAPKGKDFSGSLPLLDSKNNIWISNKSGLVKINLNKVTFYEDYNRHVPEAMVTYYKNGKEIQEKTKKYNQFFNAFAIDKYDNIISGERIFDGQQFSNVSSSKEFLNLFEGTKKENIIQLNSCFVDNESNIWYGTNNGLYKASPMPFKKIDLIYSYAENDYKLEATNTNLLKLFVKEDFTNRNLFIRVASNNNIIYSEETKLPKEDYNGISGQPFADGFIFQYRDHSNICNLIYFDGKTSKRIKSEGKRNWFLHLYTKNDSCFFLNNNNFIIVTKYSILKIPAPTYAQRIEFMASYAFNRVLLSNLTELRFNQELKIDTSAFKFPKYDFKGYWFRKSQNDSQKTLAYKDASFFLIENNECVKLNSKIPDTLTHVFRVGYGEGFYFENAFITSNYKNGYHLFLIDKEKKEIRFVRKINFSEGLIDFYYNYFFFENRKVIIYNENIEVYKIIPYDDFINKGINDNHCYKSFIWLFDQVTKKNQLNQNMIGEYVSYLGERGVNLTPPSISFSSLSYIGPEGFLKEFSPKAKDVELSHDTRDIYAEFQGICLTDGSKLKYKTRLVGLDSVWEERSSEFTYVRYPTLNPGSYTFQVKACNNNGIWNETPVEFSFTVLPPWNRTWWAYCMYVFAGFAAIRGYLKNRTKKLQKEKEKLEKTVQERTAEVVKQKHLLEEKNKEVMDSITYARRIQRSLMPTEKYISRILGKRNNKSK